MDQTRETAGIEPTIVLVGGTLSDQSNWEGLAERLKEQGFIVVAAASGPRNAGVDKAYGRALASEIDGPVLIIRPETVTPSGRRRRLGGRRPNFRRPPQDAA
jgi:hypothetical protein